MSARKKPTQWKAWVAVDKTSGAYLAGFVPSGGRSVKEFRAGISNYIDPVVKRARLVLDPPPRRKAKGRKP